MKMIHSMIRVLDLERTLDFYRKGFGLEIANQVDFESFSLIYLSNEECPFELELTVNNSQEEAYDLGNGYGHIAFSTDDLDGEHAKMKENGLEPRDIVDFYNGDTLVARFFFINDPDGYSIEVLERGGHYK